MSHDGLTGAPGEWEFELSVFGPGKGECLVVHLGHGDWVVIDSCRDPQSHEPAALQYFSRLDLSPATCVRLVVVTHWHDDHIRGIGEVFGVSKSARLAMPLPFRKQEVLSILQTGARFLGERLTSGVSELADCYRIAADRGRGCLAFGSVGSVLHWMSGRPVIRAISPSPGVEIDSLLATIASMQPNLAIGRIPNPGVNEASLALWIQTHAVSVLAGADLEDWAPVLANTSHWGWGGTKAQAYKVSHHGAASGDHPGIWTTLLSDDVDAALTPYTPSHLPTDDDVRRILGCTTSAYSTAPAMRPRAKRLDGGVERTLRMSGIERRLDTSRRLGHVRLRAPLNGNPVEFSVEFAGPAHALESL